MSLRDHAGINSGDPTNPSPLEALLGIVIPAWYSDAICAQTDPECFYPEKGGSVRTAKKTCAGCPVRSDCLQFALDNDERHGIWGGLSERERRRLKRGSRRPAHPYRHLDLGEPA